MKVLLSAYACEPNRGSEPGVGWHWAVELAALGHEVWVVTRANNRAAIEAALPTLPYPERLHFAYFDLPPWASWWKRGSKGVQLYYFLWQIGIYFLLRPLVRDVEFDLIHHVTFVSVRCPSFLGCFGIPFIFGPVSGGERAPMPLRRSYPLRGKLWDGIRDLVNAWVRFDPLMHLTFTRAQAIYATTRETLALIPRRYHHKTHVQIAIGVDEAPGRIVGKACKENGFRILYVGNLLYLKGIHLGLLAFSSMLYEYPKARLALIGTGPDKEWLKGLARQLGIEHAVEWIPKMPRRELLEHYPAFDVFLFPSLHDSGGMVILEAMSNGLPVICLDLGGPGVIVDDTCGMVIQTHGRSEMEVECDLAAALKDLARHENLRQELGARARERVELFRWSNLVQAIYGNYQ